MFETSSQQRQKNRIAGLLGTVAAATLLVAGCGSSDPTSESEAGKPQAKNDSSASASPAAPETPPRPCDLIDLSEFPKPLKGKAMNDLTLHGEMVCALADDITGLTIDAREFTNEAAAVRGFNAYANDGLNFTGDGFRDFKGPWNKGVLSQFTAIEGVSAAIIHDGNVAIAITTSLEGKVNNKTSKKIVELAAAQAVEAVEAVPAYEKHLKELDENFDEAMKDKESEGDTQG